MSLLGIDTATAASVACVLRGDGRVFERAPDAAALLGPPAHARELMPAVAEVMERAGLGFGELRAIAVGVGPGTFTGLRIGIATARGLASANGLALRPVSSLAALAVGIDGDVRLPLIDAKRGEVFAALYAGSERVWPPFAAPPDEVARRVAERGDGGAARGRDGAERRSDGDFTVLAAGDGAVRFREVLEAAGIRVVPDESGAHAVRALHVCRLAGSVPDEPPQAVLPDYVRAPDAKPR